MIYALSTHHLAAFHAACNFEHVFGSKIRTAYAVCGGHDADARFFVSLNGGDVTGAMLCAGKLLVVSSSAADAALPLAKFVRRERVTEVNTNWAQCAELQAILGGTSESSYFMEHLGGPVWASAESIERGELTAVCSVLQNSHEYYKEHLVFEPWAKELTRRLDAGLAEVFQMRMRGEIVATGSIASKDETSAVVAAVAVLPAHRHHGLGARMSGFLTDRILAMGKTPRLISGYDAVAALYRKIGYTPCGRWGELYL